MTSVLSSCRLYKKNVSLSYWKFSHKDCWNAANLLTSNEGRKRQQTANAARINSVNEYFKKVSEEYPSQRRSYNHET